MTYVKRLIMRNKKQVNMDTGLEEKATLKTELEEVREALGRRDTEVCNYRSHFHSHFQSLQNHNR